MSFQFHRLFIPDIILIESKFHEDERGFFEEIFKESDFRKNGISSTFVQDNHSRSNHGVLRGLHYQLFPKAQGKLIKVFSGEILDVAVDIRIGSQTFGKHITQKLSDTNGYILYIPSGFAHGFCVTSEMADVLYKSTAEYTPELERGIIWNDPYIGVEWKVSNPKLSIKDLSLPLFQNIDFNQI